MVSSCKCYPQVPRGLQEVMAERNRMLKYHRRHFTAAHSMGPYLYPYFNVFWRVLILAANPCA